ncbi:MAG: heavy-metal-associated domain-containing protein [Phycisphaerales bacterium]|nr:heavy-metal-associated domain-containing protein [Phycisphaerales bacterium]
MNMKVFVSTSLLGLSAIGLVGCDSTQTRESQASAVSMGSSDGASGAKMRVDGLGCPLCAENISVLMDNIDGVTDSRVDLSSGIVHVELDQTVDVAAADLRRAIDDGGFTFRSIEFVK